MTQPVKVVIHKTVDIDAQRRGTCPFCRETLLRVNQNAGGQWFYHCFRCGAGGTICLVMHDDGTQVAPIAQSPLSVGAESDT